MEIAGIIIIWNYDNSEFDFACNYTPNNSDKIHRVTQVFMEKKPKMYFMWPAIMAYQERLKEIGTRFFLEQLELLLALANQLCLYFITESSYKSLTIGWVIGNTELTGSKIVVSYSIKSV